MHVTQGAVRVFQAGERHVLDVVLEVRLPPRRHLAGSAVEEIVEDRDVVASQVVQGVDVGPERAQVGAGGRHVIDAPQGPLLDVLA